MDKRYNTLKCDFLDKETEMFVEKIKQFISAVKATITSTDVSRQVADEAMDAAVTFLTQPMPDLSDSGSSPPTVEEDSTSLAKLKEELEKTSGDVASLVQQQNCFRHETRRLVEQIVERERKKDRKKLLSLEKEYRLSHVVLERNLVKVRDFMKRTFKGGQNPGQVPETQVSEDATSSPEPPQAEGASQSAVEAGQPSGATASSEDDKVATPRLLWKHRFHVFGDSVHGKDIWSLAYLPTGMIVMNDNSNGCLWSFTDQGDYCWKETWFLCSGLAALSPNLLAATGAHIIFLLRVSWKQMKVKASMPTSKSYHALAALGSDRLAAAHGLLPHDHGIDMINMEGEIIETISTSYRTDYLCYDPRTNLIGSHLNHIFQINSVTGTKNFTREVLRQQGTQVEISGISADSRGNLLVCDKYKGEVSLLTAGGHFVRDLWYLYREKGLVPNERLSCLSVMGEQCACATTNGNVFIFDIKR